MKQTTLDLIKNINENTFIPAATQNELFELFQLDTVADLRKVSRNFMKLYELLEHLDNQTSSATSEKKGIVKLGTETGTTLEGNRLAEILGIEFGGNIQDTGNKVKGKFYFDNVTKFYYECIVDTNLTYNESSKFRAISNKPLSDKVENLYSIETHMIDPRLTVGIIHKIGNICILTLDSNELYNGRNYGEVLFNIPEKFRPKFLTPVSAGITNSASGGAVHIETSGNVVWRGARTSSALYINAVYLAK